MKNEQNLSHSIFIMENKTEIKGISGVTHYSDRELCFQIGKGSLTIQGSKLNMESLNVDGGYALVSGEVSAVKYKKGATSLIKKLSR